MADAGPVPAMRLAERVRLPGLVRESISIDSAGSSADTNPASEVLSLVRAMCAMCAMYAGPTAPTDCGT